MRKLTLNQAQQAARRGEVDRAIQALLWYAEAGNDAAAASLAELCAFREQWQECMSYAARLVANPRAVYAGNVFYEMIRLLGRAGEKTEDWDRVAEIALAAHQAIASTTNQAHLKDSSGTQLEALEHYAQQKGALLYDEFLKTMEGPRRYTQSDLDRAYAAAKGSLLWGRPGLTQDPAYLAASLFSIAMNSNQTEEALEIYFAGNMPRNFQWAVYIAQILVEKNDLDRAWDVLWSHMNLWWPMDKAQVAPVILLTDNHLYKLMNIERCEAVINLPKSPEAK